MKLHDDIELIRARIEEADTIAVFAHVRPDGDSVGSALALGWALSDMGKKVEFVSEDPIPEHFRFLFRFTEDGADPFLRSPQKADCFILPDISSRDRAGEFFGIHPEIQPDICIDHHISNQGFAKLNWVEWESPAACCVLTELLPELGFTLTERISSALLCGIITDTNSFSNSNVTAESLRNAADLIENGAKIFSISQQAYKLHTRSEMELWKLGMNNMHIEENMVWSVFRKADRDAIGYIGDDDRGFVNYMGNTANIKVAVLFIEVDDQNTKISWRALPGFDVSCVASYFGGGGHLAASGATIRGKLDEIIPAVLEKTRTILAPHSADTKDVSDEG